VSSGSLIPRKEECPRKQLGKVLQEEASLGTPCYLASRVSDEIRHVS